MPKFSHLFKASLTITFFFAINKLVALLRQGIIVRQYGFSPEIDAFNIANNVPDLLATLISGGAFAMAFIPVLSEYLHKRGREETWLLFSRVANLVFLATFILSLIVAIFAEALVKSEFGIAPGFPPGQQQLVVNLMRLNLIGTLLFSLSGLVMSALQANKHFLLPAIAPILYNGGQIFGALVLSPYFGLGIYGLLYGVILGASLHLAIQIPGMIYYRYRWNLSLSISDAGVQKVLRLMGPRILTVLFIQIIFLTRDNFASRLQPGAVTALTYGYFIMQVPETLIGTAIATALLPTLSQLAHRDDKNLFVETINRSIRVVLMLTILLTILTTVSLESLIRALFHFSETEVELLTWTTIAYVVGLASQCLLEVVTRVYYAMQDAVTPLRITAARMLLFILLSWLLFRSLGAVGLALTDSLTVSFEVGVLIYFLRKSYAIFWHLTGTLVHALLASLTAGITFYLTSAILPWQGLVATLLSLSAAILASLFWVKSEVRMLLRL